MDKKMNRKNCSRYQNVKLFLLAFLVIFFSIKAMKNNLNLRTLITNNSTIAFGLFPLIISILGIIALSFILIKRLNASYIIVFKKIIWILLLIFSAIYLFDFIVFPFIDSFIVASSLNKIPDKSEFLNSIAYIIIHHYDDFIKGVLATLKLSLIGTVIGLILGLIFVVLRTLKINKNDNEFIAFMKWLGINFTKLYVNVFRGTPMMVQAVIIYYLFPIVIARQLGISQESVDLFFTLTVSGIIIVSLNTTAYLIEVLRGGIESIDQGQMEAGRSLGLGYWQTMFHIILPQAIKNVLPAIGNEFIINIKDTSVLNVIGVAELFFVAQDAKYQYFRTYEPFIIVALIYLFLTLTTSKILAYWEKKMNIPSIPLPSSN